MTTFKTKWGGAIAEKDGALEYAVRGALVIAKLQQTLEPTIGGGPIYSSEVLPEEGWPSGNRKVAVEGLDGGNETIVCLNVGPDGRLWFCPHNKPGFDEGGKRAGFESTVLFYHL